MFFENSDDNREGEVRISTAEERKERDQEEDSKLKREAESKLLGSSSSDSGSESASKKSKSKTGSKISIEDIHRQNERIIELLEEINGESSEKEDKSQQLGGAAADGLL